MGKNSKVTKPPTAHMTTMSGTTPRSSSALHNSTLHNSSFQPDRNLYQREYNKRSSDGTLVQKNAITQKLNESNHRTQNKDPFYVKKQDIELSFQKEADRSK